MEIVFDVDNVLADSMSCWCTKASKHLKAPITKDCIRSHKIVGSVQMPAAKIFELQDQVWEGWATLPSTESHLDRKMEILRENGFKIYIATSRPKRLTECVLKWLDKMNIVYDQFFSLGPRELKTRISADALVDDAPEQIRAFVRADRVGFIYDQPWNVKARIRKAIRVRKTDDILAYYRLLDAKKEASRSLLEFSKS